MKGVKTPLWVCVLLLAIIAWELFPRPAVRESSLDIAMEAEKRGELYKQLRERGSLGTMDEARLRVLEERQAKRELEGTKGSL